MNRASADKAVIIGGRFGLDATIPDANGSLPRFLCDESIFFVNGTSAIATVIRQLRPRSVWLPSYLCVALTIAVRHAGSAVRFYPIGDDLQPRPFSWLDDVAPGDAVVVIDYFGFPADAGCIAAARARGAWVIEDATQAFLSDGAGARGDVAVFSARKFFGVPDGGILVCNRPFDRDAVALRPPPAEWWLKALNASMLRRQFDLYGGDRRWFEIFQEVEARAPVGDFCMSELSRTVLFNCVDYDAIGRRRRANYERLAGELADLAVFPELPPEVVPLGFPIRVKERDRVRAALFAHDIFPPVHWALGNVVPEGFAESHGLSAEIMTLPCDQRYDGRDMERMVTALRVAMVGRA